jgi:hypothetical protein
MTSNSAGTLKTTWKYLKTEYIANRKHPVPRLAGQLPALHCQRARKLARCRELLGMTPFRPADPPTDYRDRFEALTGRSLRECPRCRTGVMMVIDTMTRFMVCQPVPDTS